MRISEWGYYVKEGIKSLFRNKAMSFASIVSIMISLFILGIVILFVLNLDNIVKDMGSNMEVVIFLKDDMPDDAVDLLNAELKGLPGVTDVVFISKADALKKIQQDFADQKDILDGYTPDNNPFPRSFDVKLEGPSYAQAVVDAVKEKDGIEKVMYNSQVADVLNRLMAATKWAGTTMVGILLIISTAVIINTIRLAVFARHREIGIMKYIGATDWFIRWPFVVEGAILGMIGSLMSLVVLRLFYSFTINRLRDLLSMIRPIPVDDAMGAILFVIIGLGVGMGVLGSAMSLRRYLKV